MTLPSNSDIQSNVRGAIAAPVTALHEQVIKMVNDLIAQQMQQYGITFGKVTGQDGGQVRVLLDGEDDPRQVGFPRHAGVQYPKGARVAVGTTNTGDKFVLGPVNDGTGKDAEALVGSPDTVNQNVADNSLDSNHLRNNAVKNQHIDSAAVDTPQLKDNGVTNSKIASGAVDTGQLKDNSVNNSKLASGAVDSNNIKNGAVGTNQLDNGLASKINNAVQPSDLNGYAKQSDLNNLASNNDLSKLQNNINSNIVKKLSGLSLKTDSNGNVKLPNLSNV